MKREIKVLFSINENKLLRLRKLNGSLVPIDKNLTNSSKNKPYKLEVVNECEHRLVPVCDHKISFVDVCLFSCLVEIQLILFYFKNVSVMSFLDKRLLKLSNANTDDVNNNTKSTKNVIF